MVKVSFCNFWPDFQKEFDLGLKPLPYLWIKEMDDVEIVTPEEADVVIYAGFGHQEIPKYGKIKIQISYESWFINPQFFDINLIPQKLGDSIPMSFIHPFVDFHKDRYENRKLVTPSEFCCFIVSNPNCEIRNQVFQIISQAYKPIQSFGKVLKNTNEKIPEPYYSNEYLDWMGKFKFCLCFENSVNDFYVTEKLFNAYLAGCIPIYWGTKFCKTLLNENAFLFLEEETLDGVVKLLEQIKQIDNNDELYHKMRNEKLFLDKTYSHFENVKLQFQQKYNQLKN